MPQPQMGFDTLRLLGGRLCIDFVNTVENRAGKQPEEFLTSYPGLVQWGRYAGLLADGDVARLIESAAEDEPEAHMILQQAIRLREALHDVLLAIATGSEPSPANLEQVQSIYEHAVACVRLIPAGDHFVWDWRQLTPQLDQPLWPIALSAIDLLTQGDLRRVKVCANPHGCGWLFYDGSKNASRRWCSMEGCGSQVKMRRHYAKRRAAGSASVRS
jgi:predicted RNA-binding Zn ribbon-like protein